jgi:hypothetical protein
MLRTYTNVAISMLYLCFNYAFTMLHLNFNIGIKQGDNFDKHSGKAHRICLI